MNAVKVFFAGSVKLIIVSKPINRTGKKAANKLENILGNSLSGMVALEKMAKGLLVYFPGIIIISF
jgi:hypothetical protein